MDCDETKEMLYRHDVELKDMIKSINHLTQKMEILTNVIHQQNTIMEKFASLDDTLKESFSRVHKRIDKIEENQNTDGCMALNRTGRDISVLEEKTKVANNRINDIEKNLSRVAWIVLVAIIGGLLKTIIMTK